LMTEREVIAALKDAVARGVSVRVMLEEDPYGELSNEALFRDLQAAGVRVKWDNPTFRLTHEKSIVVDERLALIMTLNQSRSAFTANREYGIIDTNPNHVAEIVEVFNADWERRRPTIGDPHLVWSPVNAREKVLTLIDGAAEDLDLEQLEMQDEEVEDHLIAAVQRGVRVRVVTSPDMEANEPGLERIAAGGVEVRYLIDPRVHAKVIIADGRRALVGSINISTASLDFNRELGIIVDDEVVLEALAFTFEKDWDRAKSHSVAEATATPAPGEATATPAPGEATVTPAPGEPTVPPAEIIPWEDAAQYYGQTVTVEGTIVQTKNTGQVVFLDFSPTWQVDLKVVIFPEDAARFPSLPEEMFLHKTIRVTGVIKKYEGAPEIIVRDPTQIEIVE
jgi:cardiolipin synthase